MNPKVKSSSTITSQWVDGEGQPTDDITKAVAIKFVVLKGGANGSNQTIVLQVGDLHPNNQRRAMFHGLIQRVSDAAAKGRDRDTGKSASPADKAKAMQQRVDHLMSGVDEWSIRAARVVVKGDGLDPVALAAVGEGLGWGEDEVRDFVKRTAKKKGEAWANVLTALRGAGKIAPIYQRMMEERVKETDIDADALLEEAVGGMGDEGEGEDEDN